LWITKKELYLNIQINKVMKETQKINEGQLVQILTQVEKGEFVNIESIVKVKMNKRGNPYYNQVVKVSSKNVRCLPDYEKRVQKKTENPDFESKPNWFEHISPCVVKHPTTNETYFMYETFEGQSVRNEFIHNGNPIEKEVLTPYLPTYQERDIQVFTIKTENIKKISYKGMRYEVE
jgi:hypothetical protein